MGHEVPSFKDLWRWLKKIGHTYSCLKKWYKSSTTMQDYEELYRLIKK